MALGQSEHWTGWGRAAACADILQIAFAEWQAGGNRQPCPFRPWAGRGAAAHGLGTGSIGSDEKLTLSITCKSKPRPRSGAVRRTQRSGASQPLARARALNGPKAAWPWLGRAHGRAGGRQSWLSISPGRAGSSLPAGLSRSDRLGSSRRRRGRARCGSRGRAARRGVQLHRPGEVEYRS